MIPLATTTVTVSRSSQDGTKDLRSTITWSTYAAGVRAHIGEPAGVETVAGGSREDVAFRLDCDPCAIRHDDRVTDDSTGEVYTVEWVKQREGLGLDHTVAQLRQVTDRVSA